MDIETERFINDKVNLIIDTLNLPYEDGGFLETILMEVYDNGYLQGEANASW